MSCHVNQQVRFWHARVLFRVYVTLVVNIAQPRDGGGQSPGQQLGSVSVIFWFGSQQGDDVLQGARGLQSQSVHHVTQVVCG